MQHVLLLFNVGVTWCHIIGVVVAVVAVVAVVCRGNMYLAEVKTFPILCRTRRPQPFFVAL